MGAYMAGWFASSQFAKQNVNIGAVGLYPGATGFHFSIWLVLPDGGHRHGGRRRAHRPADAASARRLSRDRHARIRRDPAADRAERRPSLRHRLQPHERDRRDHADRRAGLRQLARTTHLHLPANFLTAGNFDSVFLWTGLGLVLITVFCSARLRDSRIGRAWIAIREDETAAAAMGVPLMRTKTWAYATGAFFGGVAGAYYASLQERRVPRRLLLPDLRVHPLHGHPRRDGEHLGRHLRRVLPRVPRP